MRVENVQSLGWLSPGSVPRNVLLMLVVLGVGDEEEEEECFLTFLAEVLQAVMVVVLVPVLGTMISGVGPPWAVTRAQPEQAVRTVLVTVVEYE